ncbi:hypothetical protein DVH24_035293 [Malus domestica]|uniref:Uncharacterized protein n=1 Tax=Malus domestica TaxID=3750 RepID=A0A498J433_MALDO|nr:hypothetical protein DVH24_035293 [Malus domestica]
MKKAYEFSTLCELDVCMTICGPKQTGRPPELHTWPENQNEASTMSKPAKKMLHLSDLLMDRQTKVYVDTYRARKEMYEAKYPTWDERIESLSENRLEALLNSLDAKLESGKRTLLHKRNQSAEHYQHICSSSQSRPCNYYKQDQVNHQEEDKKPMMICSSLLIIIIIIIISSLLIESIVQMNILSNLLSTLQLSVGPSSSNSELPFEGQHINFNNPMMIQKRWRT